ncbi:unnamed protein product [Brachionus calyciflorus]|uniref:Ferric-chelate reductase 1 n=1 Tax=Brachionus calyciflorus TaxID=104777 RepID=A0A814P2N6_9BILA|nr:unnamed protein product [Brachionus calyciflorus]
MSNRVRKPMTPVIAAGGFSSGDYKLSWNETTYYTIYSGGEGGSSAKAKSLRLKRQATGADKYLAYGLSLDKSMGQDCIVVCKMINNIGTVEHYYATGKVTPSLLDPNEPTVGITDATVSYVNGNIQCKFTREKYIDSVPRYCDSSKNKYYLQIAEGSIYGGIIQKHGSDVVVSDSVIDFSVNTTFSGSVRDAAKSKAHACLMVFAWMFCVSTGIILARYYKYILPSIKIQKMMFWFQAHRAIMIFVPICSLAAFLVILADVGWKWVETTSKVSFAHSIFGMVLIGLSLIQVFFGFLRPDKDAPRRPLFNVLHKFTGMSCLTLAVVTCYLGVFIERMNLGRIGWGIMIGWTMWVLILPLLIELVQVLCAQTKSDSYQITQDKLPPIPDEGNKKLIERIKTALLFLHLLISFGHVIALIVVIGVAEPGKFVSD